MERDNGLTRNLTDEQVLDEFVKRFQCDAAVLIYLDSDNEFGFSRWQNPQGRKWARNLFKRVKQDTVLELEE